MTDKLRDTVGSVLEDPLFNVGMGLLARSGPSRERSSLGQNLAEATARANRMQQGIVQNKMNRARLDAIGQQQEAQRAFAATLGPQQAALFNANPAAYTAAVTRQMFPQALDPQSQLQMMMLHAQLSKANRENVGAEADRVSAIDAAINSMGTLSGVFDRIQETGNPFADGGVFAKDGLFGAIGIDGAKAAIRTQQGRAMLQAKGFDPAMIELQIADAETLEKETAALVNQVSNLGGALGGNTATAMNNSLTAVGSGASIPARRRATASVLGQMIESGKLKGMKFEQEKGRKLLDKLKEQNRAFEQRAGVKSPGGNQPAQEVKQTVYNGPVASQRGKRLPTFNSAAQAERAMNKKPSMFPVGSHVVIGGVLKRVME